MSGVSVEVAKEAMRLAIFKLPIKCKFVTKADLEALALVHHKEPAEETAAEEQETPAQD
jgi:large subunit ribosomal protein L16